METKKGGFKQFWDSFHQTSWNFVGISTVVCGSFWGGGGVEKKIKMAATAMVTKVQNGCQIQKSSDLGKIWFPSRLWCCELIFIVGLLWCSELDETFQKFCLTCVHIILRLRNFRMAAVATKNVNNLKCSELDEA